MMRMVGPPGMNPFPGMPSNMQGNPGMFGQHMGAPVPHQAMHMMQGMGPPGGQMGTQPMNPALGGPQAGGMNRNTLQQVGGCWFNVYPVTD